MSANAFDREYETDSFQRPLRARTTGARAALGMGVGASVILAAAALLTRHTVETQTVADAGAPAAVEAHAKITTKATTDLDAAPGTKSASALDIEAPEFDREKKVVAVGDPKGDEPRVDSLTVGQFAMGAPFLRIDIHPDLDPKATNADFFLDMTRHARAVGLSVAKIGQPGTLATRFGAFETADIRLSQPGGEGVEASERACLATRFVDVKAPLEIAGIACGSATAPIDRASLGCMLDKLSYSAGGDNKPLNDFFLNAELARGKGCTGVSREDVTASIPPHRTARAKPVASKPVAKKGHAVARSAPVHSEGVKN
ncbi:MAG: hypothetical protein CTY15_07025 [Methylocystis sp.]|nr:MAG: hypothetical protein CTY15_07025 [Methylocystis sp.]